jgi:hypothetical protein
MRRPENHPERGPDLALWEAVTTAYRTKIDGHAPPRGSNNRTETARASRIAVPGQATAVDLYVDPVCPHTRVVACWLREVGRLRPVDVRHNVMSLDLLNEGGVLHERYRGMVGPSLVAAAVVRRYGPEALRSWHGEFGARIFDHWRYPSPQEYRTAALDALAATGLATHLADAAGSEEYDAQLRTSTDQALVPVGVDGVGTPIVHVDGAAFFGPVLNAVPLAQAALRLFEGVRLLAGSPEFFELKRTRTSPPDLSYRTMTDGEGHHVVPR